MIANTCDVAAVGSTPEDSLVKGDPRGSEQRSETAMHGYRIFALEGLILFSAVFLRLWGLDWKPAHFDEGINGWFSDQMRIQGFYSYDPKNYHGPLYFYLLFICQTLFGRNLWALRLPAVLSSLGTVWLALSFNRFIGKRAALFASLALAISPAAVFYGRYSIHESSLVFSLMLFTLGVFGLWQIGDKRSLWISITGATMMLLLKETAVIHLGCFVFAALILFLLGKDVSRHILPQQWTRGDLIKALLISLSSLIFFYSGTLLNCQGLLHVFQTIPAWIHTGMGAGGHEKLDYQFGWFNFYWIALMMRYEWPSLAGFFYAGWLLIKKRTSAPLRYLSIYALVALTAYSLIPYKTPWCFISITWPFVLLFGVVAQDAWTCKRGRILATSLMILLLIGSLAQCMRLNFRHYVDFSEPYVYVQTSPEIKKVTAPLLKMAQEDPRNLQLRGQVFLESYYPLPWILGDFTSIGYYAPSNPPRKWNGDFIFVEASLAPQVEKQVQEPYYQVPFQLRDGMEQCVGFFKKKFFQSYFEKNRISEHGYTP